eukprot:COSAG06_NODE_1171_length_10418_cov_8.441216_14_plen_40_part_00
MRQLSSLRLFGGHSGILYCHESLLKLNDGRLKALYTSVL